MQADGVMKRYVPACLTAAKTGTRAVVPAPGRSDKDLTGPDFGLKEGRKEGGQGFELEYRKK